MLGRAEIWAGPRFILHFLTKMYPLPPSENFAGCDIKFLGNVTSGRKVTEKHGGIKWDF